MMPKIISFVLVYLAICLFHCFCALPEENMNTIELIEYAGFKAESHVVVTEDGYILKLHRIPNKGKVPVFLQHGLLSSSTDWVVNNVNQSLGFILAKNGYDVWLGNFRGNTYSRNHTHLNPDDKQFWLFSWDQMAEYDLPAMIDYVLNETLHKSLYYVGHSMGTTSAFALFSSKPEYNEKVNMYFALAPVTFTNHMKGPLFYLSRVIPEVKLMMKMFGIYEFFPRSKITDFLTEMFCVDKFAKDVCLDTIFLLCGFDKQELNQTRLPVYLAHTPAGSSTQTILHYAQLAKSKLFTKYDYGPEENQRRYNQTSPPEYDLHKVTTPTVSFWGENDWLADPTDVLRLEDHILKALHKSIRIKNDAWNHLDFIWAVDSYKLLYKQILEMLEIDIRKEK